MIRPLLFRFVNWISRTFFASRLSYSHIQAFLYNNSWRKFANLIRVHVDVYLGRQSVSSRPYIVILEVTNICNLQCPFCLTGKGISGGRENRHMSFEEARKVIDAIADTAYFLQLYTWGEPLLNKDILAIVDYAKQRGLYVMLSTNGTALTQTYSERLISAGLDYLMIAIDGGSAETYRQYRIGGDFDRVLANLAALLSAREAHGGRRPFVEWQFIVFRHNEQEVAETERRAYAMGVDKFTPLPAYVEDESWLPQGEKYRTATLYNPERLKNCSRPWSHLNVRADGGVASCCYEFFKKDDFGNLRQSAFEDTWNNARFRESRKLIQQFTRTGRMDDSTLICHSCLASGVRPSYFEINESTPKVEGRRVIPVRVEK